MSAKELIGASEVTSMSPPYSDTPAQRRKGALASYGLLSEDRLGAGLTGGFRLQPSCRREPPPTVPWLVIGGHPYPTVPG